MTLTALDIYRRTLTTAEEDDSVWWYLGTSTVEAEGHPEIIVSHVETVMIYRARTLGEASYRVPWWEIGVFRDAITGELPETWTNPVTGVVVEAAVRFEEGPSGFSLRDNGRGGIEMFDAVQAFAALESADIAISQVGSRVMVTQTEIKTRSFPGKDGIPDLAAGEGSRSRTVLQWLADRAELESGAPSVHATGMYSLEIAAPPWLGFGDTPVKFMVKGLMVKAPLEPVLNPRGWSDLQKVYPQYFQAGQICPRWE